MRGPTASKEQGGSPHSHAYPQAWKTFQVFSPPLMFTDGSETQLSTELSAFRRSKRIQSSLGIGLEGEFELLELLKTVGTCIKSFDGHIPAFDAAVTSSGMQRAAAMHGQRKYKPPHSCGSPNANVVSGLDACNSQHNMSQACYDS